MGCSDLNGLSACCRYRQNQSTKVDVEFMMFMTIGDKALTRHHHTCRIACNGIAGSGKIFQVEIYAVETESQIVERPCYDLGLQHHTVGSVRLPGK